MNAPHRLLLNAFCATAFTLGSAVAVAQTTGPAAAEPPRYAPDVPAKITTPETDQTRIGTLEEITKQKQNPVSGLKSVWFQDVNTQIGGRSANSFSVQVVWPFEVSEDWKLITYTIVPYERLPLPDGSTATGLGNVLFNGYFRPEKSEGSFTWGVGPAIVLPTRTNSNLGSNRVSLGPALLLYDTSGPWAGGVVLQNYWSLGGSGANRVNQMDLQYFVYYNFSGGTYLESNATIVANWVKPSSERWTVPIGGGVGKTFNLGGSTFYSASLQAFYNVERPWGVGPWSVLAQFQIIFSQ